MAATGFFNHARQRDHRLYFWALTAVSGAFLLACDAGQRSDSTGLDASVTPLCQIGCTETDPNPEAPGVFLGSGVTPGVCYFGEQTDADQDGLGDFCEKNLAAAFAPELYYYNGDNVGREPYWVAQMVGQDVRVAYLLSYYRDEGSQITYPSHLGAYPRAYVSEGKHANYSNISECNSGGTFWSDDCNLVNTSARVDAGASLNQGSRATHSASQDCIASRNPSYEYYSGGRLECYWTIQDFRGWIPDSVGGPSSSAYSNRLAAWGF